MPLSLPHVVLSAATALLLSSVHAQDIPIGGSSLDQVATDTFLNVTCLSGANPGVSDLAVGDTFVVPLDCCGVQSFTCGGPFCMEIPACAALEPGLGTISVTTAPVTLTASVTGTMASTVNTDTTATTTADSSVVDSATDTATATDAESTATNTGDDSATATTNGPSDTAGGSSDVSMSTSTVSSSTSTDSDGAIVVVPIVTVVPVPVPNPVPNPDPVVTPDPTADPDPTSNPEPTAEPTTTPPPDATQTTEEPSSTTSSSSTEETPQPTAYMISTKPDTARSAFDDFIKTLPDQGEGDVIAYDNIPWQSYVTKNLTAEQANEIKGNPIVDMIGPIIEEEGEAGVIAASNRRAPRISKREDSTRPGSDYHLGMLSAPRDLKNTQDWPDYEFDTQLGKGQTVYVIDTGYRSTHEEFAANGRTVRDFVVPNAFTLQCSPHIRPDDILAPEDTTDWNGHGTMVASVAGGVTQGVASQADLVIVKFRNAAAASFNPTRFQIRQVTAPALRAAWDFAFSDILAQRQNGYTGKAVINMSYGFKREGPLPLLSEQIMDRNIPFAQENDITVVVAAGNDGMSSVFLDQITPQNLGTTNNGLITVGGLEKDGSLYKDTTPDRGNGGSLSIYAAARDVKVASHQGDSEFTTGTGTSLAAPAVAGMASYFFSISQLDANWPQGSVAQAMKQFYALSARVQRNDNPVPGGLPYDGPSAGSVVCAWNRHPVGFDTCSATTKHKRQDDGDLPDLSCENPTTTTPPSTTTEPTTTADSTPTTAETTTAEEATPTSEPPATTEAPEPSSTEKPCTLFYGTTSSCVASSGANCPPASSLNCPLAKRGAHAATLAPANSFVTTFVQARDALPTIAAMV